MEKLVTGMLKSYQVGEEVILEAGLPVEVERAAATTNATSGGDTEILSSSGNENDLGECGSGQTQILRSSAEMPSHGLRSHEGVRGRKSVLSANMNMSSPESGNSVATRTRSRTFAHSPSLSPALESNSRMVDNPEVILRKRRKKQIAVRKMRSAAVLNNQMNAVEGPKTPFVEASPKVSQDLHTLCKQMAGFDTSVPAETGSCLRSSTFDHLGVSDISSHKSRDLKSPHVSGLPESSNLRQGSSLQQTPGHRRTRSLPNSPAIENELYVGRSKEFIEQMKMWRDYGPSYRLSAALDDFGEYIEDPRKRRPVGLPCDGKRVYDD
ncbi:hypothetical protein EJB05_55559, partial [Eragrostis curvula]